MRSGRSFGKYELLRHLGSGGMADLFLAKTTGSAGFEKYVALKMIHPRFADDAQFIRMLVDEAKIAVQLTHRNIVQTFDLGRVDDTYYITMEYVDGMDLSRLLALAPKAQLALPMELVAFIGKEIASALDYAHWKTDTAGEPLGIVHRDVSPPNVMISDEGAVKLVDFGVARAAMKVRQTSTNAVVGKLTYMSPEQARGDETIDHRSDIFSMGLVLYEMICGQPAYQAGGDIDWLIELARKADIVPPSVLREGIPTELEQTVMRALERRPEDRHASALELATELQEYVQDHAPGFSAMTLADWVGALIGAVDTESEEHEVYRSSELVCQDNIARGSADLRDQNSVLFDEAEVTAPLRPVTQYDDVERFGPYEIHERLGAGGMAVVHHATIEIARGVRRDLALKRLLPQVAHSKVFVDSFIREARLAAQLHHPNIVQILELGRVKGSYFIAMELVRGSSLVSLMVGARKAKRPAPIGVVIAILGELCDALEYATNATDNYGEPLRIVHRDLSPSNLLITGAGQLKIIDFGVAKALTGGEFKTNSGLIKGKLGYMSPEAMSGKALDARADIFSAGVIAWELIAGRRLFKAKADEDIVSLVRDAAIARPSSCNAACPTELDAIVLKALAPARDDRWSSAASLLAALAALRRFYGNQCGARDVAAWVAEVSPPPSDASTTARLRLQTDREPPSRAISEAAPRAGSKIIRMDTVGFAPAPYEDSQVLQIEDQSKSIWIERVGPMEPVSQIERIEDPSKSIEIERPAPAPPDEDPEGEPPRG